MENSKESTMNNFFANKLCLYNEMISALAQLCCMKMTIVINLGS